MPPLIGERSNADGASRETATIADGDGLTGGRGDDQWPIGYRKAVEAEVIDAKVPAIVARLGDTESHGGLIVRLAEANDFYALRAGQIVIDAGAQVRAEAGPLALGDADEGAIITWRRRSFS